MTTLPPQEIERKCLWFLEQDISRNSIIVTVPQKFNSSRGELCSYARKYQQILQKSSKPILITLEPNIKYVSPCSIILGLARDMRNYAYRQQFITLSLSSPLTDPVDILFIPV